MNNLELLMDAFNYIEQNLKENINTASICSACGCSKSTLEKLFRCVNSLSVHDYVVRRKMMLAAREISVTQKSLLEIAIDYGYTTNESFTRAFKGVWNMNPSEVRGKKLFELFPRLRIPQKEGDDYIMSRKNFEISELYDLFEERKNCYFICCDIKGLVPINEISHKAGDLAILESMNRMNRAAGENDIVFRIGGDEFCMLTSSDDLEYAETIQQKIQQENGKTIIFEGKEIPVSLYVSCVKYAKKHVRYNDLFAELHNAIKSTK